MSDIRSFFKPLSNKTSNSSSTHGDQDKSSPKLKHSTKSKSSGSLEKKKPKKHAHSKNKTIEVISSDEEPSSSTSTLKKKTEKTPSKEKEKRQSNYEETKYKKHTNKPGKVIKVESSDEEQPSCYDNSKKVSGLSSFGEKHVKESHSSLNLQKVCTPSHQQKKKHVDNGNGSDSSDIVDATPVKVQKKKRKLHVISSDSEDEKFQSKTIALGLKSGIKSVEKLKPVSISDIFTKGVKQSKVETPSQPREKEQDSKKARRSKKDIEGKNKTEIGIHEDEDFEKTLLDLDDDIFIQNEDILNVTIESAMQKTKNAIETSKGAEETSIKNESILSSAEVESTTKQGEPSKKRQYEEDLSKNESFTKTKKPKLDHTDSGIDDADRYDKLKYCAMQYQKYLNRSGPIHHGSKELPKGKPDCLAHLCFLRTGVLDSLQSDEFEDLIKQHGGRVVHAVSKKVNYVVVGDDAGPSKLEKAKKYGIPNINEDELLDMILEKSGMPKKFTVSVPSSFEDAGINDSFISNESEVVVESRKQNEDLKIKKTSEERSVAKKLTKKSSPIKPTEQTSSSKYSLLKEKPNTEIKKAKPKNKEEEVKIRPEISEAKKDERIQSVDINACLSEKYKPTELKQIVGQQMMTSNMNKLKKWLENWSDNEKLRKLKKIPQPKPWDRCNDGAYYKCALLSGAPGVGKTTTATLVAKTLGFDIVEFNASDTRSKKLLQQDVASALGTQNISSFNLNSSGLDSKRVILMDEVDGMAGNEDRGGMQELINLIKLSKIPIICMCNDRNHQKMRSLANYCYDLRFEKPKPQQILGFVMSICCKEGIKMTPQVANEIIYGTTCDIRQTLNQISMLSNLDTGISLTQAQKESAASKKDSVLGCWQVCKMVFNEADQKDMSLIDKSRLFFYDYSMGPLFVHENYLKVQPNVNKAKILKNVASAAEAISMGATIDKKIRELNNWSLLDMQAIYSSVLPGYYMKGQFTGAVDFPRFLGKTSKMSKLRRLNTELAMHTRIETSGGALAMKLDYSKPMVKSILNPMKQKGLAGVPDAVEVMKSYHLLREDLDSLIELSTWPKQNNMWEGIDSKVKTAFTKSYSKNVPVFSYSVNAGVSKKKTSTLYDEDLNEDDDQASESEDTVTHDHIVKLKTKSKAQTKGQSKASSSNQKGKGKKGKK